MRQHRLRAGGHHLRVGAVLPAGDRVYGVEQLGCGNLKGSSTDGTQTETVVDQVGGISELSANATHVYFIAGDGQLLRVAR